MKSYLSTFVFHRKSAAFLLLGLCCLFCVTRLEATNPPTGSSACSSCGGCDCSESNGEDSDPVDDDADGDENADGEDGEDPQDMPGTTPATQTQQPGEQAPNNVGPNADGGGQDTYPASFSDAAQNKPYLTVAAMNGGGAALKVRFFLGDVASPRPADHRSFYYAGGVNSLVKDLPASWKANESFFNEATTGGLVPSYATIRASRAHPDVFDPEEIITYNHALFMEVADMGGGESEFKTKQYRVVVTKLAAPEEGFKLEYYHRRPTNHLDPLDTEVTKTVTVSNPTPGFYRFVDIDSVWKDGAGNEQERYIRYDLPTAMNENPPAIGKLEATLSVRKTIYFTPPTGALTAQGDGPREEIAFHDTIDGSFVKTVWLPTLNTTPASHYIASQEMLRHRSFGGVKRLVAHTRGYNTDQPLTTRYGYMATPENVDTQGRRHFVIYPDGRWQVHKYSSSSSIVTSNGNAFDLVNPGGGQPPQTTVNTSLYERIYEPIGNQEFTTDFPEDGTVSANYQLTTLVSSDKGAVEETVSFGGQTVSSEYRWYREISGPFNSNTGQYVYGSQSGSYITEQSLRIQNRRTEAGRTTIATYGSSAASFLAGRVAWKKFPDGTAEVYSYANNVGGIDGRYQVTKKRGAYPTTPSTVDTPQVGANSVTEITVRNAAGAIQKHQVLEGGLVISEWEAIEFDDQGRPTKIIENGDLAHPRLREYGCCGLLSETAPNGVKTETFKDRLKRTSLVKVTAGNRVTETSYRISGGQTAAGHPTILTEVVRTGYLSGAPSVSEEIPVSKTLRHVNGLVLKRWTADEDGDQAMEETTIATQYGVNGFGKVVTTTNPAGTREVTSYCDGRTFTVKGSAVADMKYLYTANRVRTIRLQYDGTGAGIESDWTETLRDLAGRTTHTYYSSGNDYTAYSYYTSGYYGDQVIHEDRDVAGSWGRLHTMTDPDGVVTTYTYNDEGERTTVSRQIPGHPDPQVTKTTNSPATYTDHHGVDSYHGIETTTRVIGAGDATGIVTSKTFRSGDGMFTRSESFSRVTSSLMIYGLLPGNWTRETSTPTAFSEQVYSNGLMQSSAVRDEEASTSDITSTTYSYDLLGRPRTTIHSRTGLVTYSSYTDSGNLLSMDDHGRVTAYEYDQLGRRIKVNAPDTTDPAGAANNTDYTNITHTSYYPTGQVKATWGDNVYPRFYEYDEQNRMTKLHTYKVAPALDHTVDIAPAGSATTTWNYNPNRGWLDNKRDAGNQGASYTYTASGRLATRTWARGVVTTYGYDHGQLTSVTYSNETNNYTTPNLAYTYTKFGQLDTVTRGGQLHADYDYSAANLLLKTEKLNQDVLARTLTRHYDGLLRPSGIELMDGATVEHAVSYGYDSVGRLKHVHPAYPLPTDATTSDFSYDYQANSSGLLETVTSPVHTVTNLWESDRNVLDKKTNKLTGGVEVSAYDYEVNALGQRESVAMSGSAFSGSSTLGWSYDAQGQLIAADHSASSAKDQAFLYDSIGNRKREVHGGLSLPGSDNYTTDAENQYSSSPSNSSLSHDSDGNMTSGQVPSDPGAGGVETSGSFEDTSNIVWDAENRLVQIKVRKGGASSHRLLNYEYDYLGRRIKRIKTQNSVVSIFHFAYDGWNPLSFVVEKVGGPEIAQKYTWGQDLSGSMQGAGGVGGLLVTEFVNSGAALDDFYYPVYDGNGNVCQYLDSNGNADARFEYDSFGRIVSNTGEEVRKSLRHRFSTKHRDVHSGLYYYGYRYYNPVTGRWLSRDPIQERGGVNLYGFVGNNGIKFVDRLGLSCFDALLDAINNPHNVFGITYSIKAKCFKRCCCKSGPNKGDIYTRQYIYRDSGRVWNASDIISKLDAVPKNCKIYFFEISAHHSGDEDGGSIWGPDDGDSITDDQLVDAIDPNRFGNNARIDLEMCNSTHLADKIEEKLGNSKNPSVESTDGENRNIPGTPFDVPGGDGGEKDKGGDCNDENTSDEGG